MENSKALLERISSDPNICFGRPVIKGTRIWVSLIFDFLASGMKEEQILSEYPQLNHDDIRAACAYASLTLNENRVLYTELSS